MANVNSITKATLLTGGLSSIGFVTGIVVAIKRKSGFWGGFGWAILGSILGGGIGRVTSSLMNFDDTSDKTKISDSSVQKLINASNNFGADVFEGVSVEQAKSYMIYATQQDIIDLTKAFHLFLNAH